MDEIKAEIRECMEYFNVIKNDEELESHQRRLDMLLFRQQQLLATYDY